MATQVLWRLERKEYANTAFSGEGASRYGARFNSQSTRVVYTAENLPLALLETLAGLTDYDQLYQYVFFRAELPEKYVETLNSENLPPDWTVRPPAESTKHIGDTWIRSARSLALGVPSVVVPYSYNYLINPDHPNFEEITIYDAETLPVDRRLVE